MSVGAIRGERSVCLISLPFWVATVLQCSIQAAAAAAVGEGDDGQIP